MRVKKHISWILLLCEWCYWNTRVLRWGVQHSCECKRLVDSIGKAFSQHWLLTKQHESALPKVNVCDYIETPPRICTSTTLKNTKLNSDGHPNAPIPSTDVQMAIGWKCAGSGYAVETAATIAACRGLWWAGGGIVIWSGEYWSGRE